MRLLFRNISIILFFITGSEVASPLYAQVITSPEQVALNGGVTFVTGTAAQFHNPANLMIRDNRRPHQVTLGMGGLFYGSGVPFSETDGLPGKLENYFMPSDFPHTSEWTETDENRFSKTGLRYYQTRKYDMVPAGFSYRRESSVRSIAIRSRGSTSFEMNSDWFYAPSDTSVLNDSTLTRFLHEKYQVYYEVSFGFAREVTMFNQWQAGLNTLYIGLSPKIVAGGMHAESEFRSRYDYSDHQWHNTKYLNARMSGDMQKYVQGFLTNGDAETAFHNSINPSSNLQLNGLGFGMDAGLTYIMPLGDDLSLSPHIDRPLRKSLRISLAVTDIGLIRYSNNTMQLQEDEVTAIHDRLPESDAAYAGRPGEFFYYLSADSAEKSVLEGLEPSEDGSYTTALPTELHLGAAVQYNRIIPMVNLNYGFQPSDYQPRGWRMTVGTELRLLRFLPVMGSIQMNPDRDFTLGVGAGLDLGLIQISAAMRIHDFHKSSRDRLTNTVAAMAMQVRF